MTTHMQHNIIIAGSTGLIGLLLVDQALQHTETAHVISLSRHAIKQNNPKLTHLINPNLTIDDTLLGSNKPSIGFIALGSTKKKAGSKAALKAVDVTLVLNVAKAMKQVGVESICIVSCIGASQATRSHYLHCKGEMEAGIEAMGFERTIFMQPGPLAGQRKETRPDEWLLQGMMKLVNPLMKGKLLNYKPIEAQSVAQSMLYFSFNNLLEKGTQRYTSEAMFALPLSL